MTYFKQNVSFVRLISTNSASM